MSGYPEKNRTKMAEWSLALSIFIGFGSIFFAAGIYFTLSPIPYILLGVYFTLAVTGVSLGFLGLRSRARDRAMTAIVCIGLVTVLVSPLAFLGLRDSSVKENLFKIEAELDSVCSGQGNSSAQDYFPDTEKTKIVAISPNEKPGTYFKIPGEFRPATLNEVQLVLCLEDEREVVVQTCNYSGGKVIKRYQYTREVQLYQARNAELVAQGIIKGIEPEKCPQMATNGFTMPIYGERTDSSAIGAWIKKVIFKSEGF